MTIYHQNETIPNTVLSKYQSMGFRYVEPDDHLINLYFYDDLVAVFNQTKLTQEILHQSCEMHLQKVGVV